MEEILRYALFDLEYGIAELGTGAEALPAASFLLGVVHGMLSIHGVDRKAPLPYDCEDYHKGRAVGIEFFTQER